MIEITGKYTNATIYTDNVEDGAIKQITDLCNNIASTGSVIKIMPDVHEGNGCTIGTTMTIRDRITPNLVGVDIACGMLVCELNVTEIDFEEFDKQVRRSVPSGFNSRKTIHEFAKSFPIESLACYGDIKCGDKPLYQLGTLGGGNHFIELDRGSDGKLYLVIHSGSRNIGKVIAEYYQDLACELNFRAASEARRIIIERVSKDQIQEELDKVIPANKDLAFLLGEDMANYISDCNAMYAYASLNRAIMAHEIVRNVGGITIVGAFSTIHNYIDSQEMILRKGAISAKLNEKVIIPMNMRDGSIIALGKGNPDWNCSAPHGAGRVMGRKEAKRTVQLDDFVKSMEGIYSTSISKDTLDESPMVYKPMEEIVKYVDATIDIIDVIKPIYNFKSS